MGTVNFTVYTCDRCGTTVQVKSHWKPEEWQIAKLTNVPGKARRTEDLQADFCEDCALWLYGEMFSARNAEEKRGKRG